MAETAQPRGAWSPIVPVPAVAGYPPTPRAKPGETVTPYDYRDPAAALLGRVIRIDRTDGGKDFYPQTYCQHSGSDEQAWRFKSWPVPRPLYGLDRLAAMPAAPVLVAEGEKAADAVQRMVKGWVVVTWPGGSNAVAKADWLPTADRNVFVWPDADEPGHKAAAKVAELATAAGAAGVAIVTPPDGVPPGWDAADAVAERWTAAQLEDLLNAAMPWQPPAADGQVDKKPKAPPQRDMLAGIVDPAWLWHDEDGRACVTIPINGHEENWPVRSSVFRSYIAGQFHHRFDSAPSSQAIEDVLKTMEACARFDGPCHPVFRRVGAADDKVYLDLGDPAWRMVEIDGDGWRVRGDG